MSCLAPVDDCVDEGDDQQKSDQARHHQVGSWQTLAVATIVILISNIIIVINIKMLESLGRLAGTCMMIRQMMVRMKPRPLMMRKAYMSSGQEGMAGQTSELI